MTTFDNSENELLTEHFGYPPCCQCCSTKFKPQPSTPQLTTASSQAQSLIDDIINSINILAERALNSVEQGLLNAPPAALGFKSPKSQSHQQQDAANTASLAERAKDEIEAGTHQLETLLCASIDRNFDKFELYVLRNILTVNPPELCNWMRLSHYDGLDFSSAPSITNEQRPKDVPTIESITLLRRRLRESMRLNALLTAERARNDVLLDDLRRLISPPSMGSTPVKAESASPEHRRNDAPVPARDAAKSPFAFLHQKGDLASSGGGPAPLATTAAFTLSQMQALRALSTALSNLTPDLKDLGEARRDGEEEDEAASTTSRKSWRRERAEYVEAATRRHLEIMHGLELGKQGEVRDGDWQGAAPNLAQGEVTGLEGVVTLIQEGGDVGSAPAPEGAMDVDVDEDRMDES